MAWLGISPKRNRKPYVMRGTWLLNFQPMMLSGRGVTAVLGPTNTGKTHYAIERMVAHGTGVIGLPLRLLAREVYTRLVDKVGVSQVALVTGEEKITPARTWAHLHRSNTAFARPR